MGYAASNELFGSVTQETEEEELVRKREKGNNMIKNCREAQKGRPVILERLRDFQVYILSVGHQDVSLKRRLKRMYKGVINGFGLAFWSQIYGKYPIISHKPRNRSS
jgi:hypothetical protein